jgi:hypothetical protein
LRDIEIPVARPFFGRVTFAFARRPLMELRLRKASVRNVCIRIAMTLVQLLRLHRFCDNLRETEVNRLLYARGLARALLHTDAPPMMSMPDEGLAAFPRVHDRRARAPEHLNKT